MPLAPLVNPADPILAGGLSVAEKIPISQRLFAPLISRCVAALTMTHVLELFDQLIQVFVTAFANNNCRSVLVFASWAYSLHFFPALNAVCVRCRV